MNKTSMFYNAMATNHNWKLVKEAENIINVANKSNENTKTYISITIGDKTINLKPDEKISISYNSITFLDDKEK